MLISMSNTPAEPQAAQRVGEHSRGAVRKWLGRLGLAGFLFFFLKGMVWLVLLFVVYEGCTA